MHERLRVDVFVVFDEVETALQRFIHHATIVLTGQPKLRLCSGTQERPSKLVESLALDHDPGGRSLEGFHVGDWQAHVFQPQRLDGLKAEDVADQRGGEVGN